jgi:hypothetical protein
VHHGHDNVGIDHYEEQSRRVGGEWETLYDAAGVGVFPTGPAQLRIRAIDQACNASDWKVIDSDVRAVDAVEGVGITTAGVSQAYVGQWQRRSAAGAYRRTLMANQTSGSKARLVATGTRYALVVRRTTAGGRIGIYVDGVRVRTVDLRSTGGLKQERIVAWQQRYQRAKQRVIQVRTLVRPADSRAVLLDAWIVER